MLHITEEGQVRAFAISSSRFRKIHATDPPVWWCDGYFSRIPVRQVAGHPIYRCESCGEELYVHDAPGVSNTGTSHEA